MTDHNNVIIDHNDVTIDLNDVITEEDSFDVGDYKKLWLLPNKTYATTGGFYDVTNENNRLLGNRPANLRLSRCDKRNSDGTTPPETPKSPENENNKVGFY